MALWQSCLVVVAFFAVGNGLREASDEEFPFQVSIKSSDWRHLCGGAIITSKWVLTVSTCLTRYESVIVSYGSVDSNSPKGSIKSRKIEVQDRLALIELETAIDFSHTVKQASLPTHKARLLNTTKLSGWKVEPFAQVPPSLYVEDKYFMVEKDCRKITGVPVNLAADEFCGMDQEQQNYLGSQGAIVSKKAIVIGILPKPPILVSEPQIFVKLSEHEQWIRDVLRDEAHYVTWVDKIPKNSGVSHSAAGLAFTGMLTVLIRYL